TTSRLAADLRHLDLRQAHRFRGTNLRIAIIALPPDAADFVENLFVRSAMTQEFAQVVAFCGKQTEIQLSFGGEPRPRAASTERLSHRSDHADLTGAVGVSVSLDDLAEVIRLQRLDRPFASDALEDLAARDNVFEPPPVGGADVHVFDEANDVAGPAEMTGHVDDALIVHAALDDHVNLDRL